MPGFRLFMTVLVARPAEPLEYAIMAAAVIAMGLVSAITVMMALADSVYIAGPAPLGNFDPVFYTGPFESLEPQASWLSLYTSVRSGVEGLFAPLLASYSWVILLFYSVTSGILLHPVLSKIRSQLPFAFYRTGLTPGRAYFYSLLYSYAYSLPLLGSVLASPLLASVWASLDFPLVYSSSEMVYTMVSVSLIPLVFSSLYLATGRTDLSLLASILASASFYLLPLIAGFNPILPVLAVIGVSSWTGARVSAWRWAY